MSGVVALYVDPRGPYPKLNVDWWGEKRDARNFVGDAPIVAHPACGPWGSLRHLYRGGEGGKELAIKALEQVRKNGGVLEHPRGSLLWREYNLPRPGKSDEYGFTIAVNQVDWGHACVKPTWLYVCGYRGDKAKLLEEIANQPKGVPTHRIWSSKKAFAFDAKAKELGLKAASREIRRRTPKAFAELLIRVAENCGPKEPLEIA